MQGEVSPLRVRGTGRIGGRIANSSAWVVVARIRPSVGVGRDAGAARAFAGRRAEGAISRVHPNSRSGDGDERAASAANVIFIFHS